MLAGIMGDEVYRADFLVNDDGRWTSYKLNLTPIFDALFVSDKDVVACGLNVRTINEKDRRLKDAGVILRSFDGGKSWQTIYRTKSFESCFFFKRI